MGRNQEVMRGLIRLIRIYTPFICTVMALLNGVLFIKGVTELPAIYLMTTLTGNSVLVDLYMFATSMRMCVVQAEFTLLVADTDLRIGV